MSTYTVLLVDDEPEILEALRRTLRAEGYRLLTAAGRVEARAHLAATSVDVVLSDVNMLGSSGVDLTIELKRTHPHVARVLLTGVVSSDFATGAINDGTVHRIVTKPCDDHGLREALREALLRDRAAPSPRD